MPKANVQDLLLASADILEKAADTLESGRMGWTQGQLVQYDDENQLRAVCAVGALRLTADVLPSSDRLARRSCTALNFCLQIEYMLDTEVGGLASWNDVPGRTVEDVVELFKLKAKDLRNEYSEESL